MARGRARERGGGLRGRCQITLDKVEMQLKSFAKAESTCTGRVYLGSALLCSGLAAAWQGKRERVREKGGGGVTTIRNVINADAVPGAQVGKVAKFICRI